MAQAAQASLAARLNTPFANTFRFPAGGVGAQLSFSRTAANPGTSPLGNNLGLNQLNSALNRLRSNLGLNQNGIGSLLGGGLNSGLFSNLNNPNLGLLGLGNTGGLTSGGLGLPGTLGSLLGNSGVNTGLGFNSGLGVSGSLGSLLGNNAANAGVGFNNGFGFNNGLGFNSLGLPFATGNMLGSGGPGFFNNSLGLPFATNNMLGSGSTGFFNNGGFGRRF